MQADNSVALLNANYSGALNKVSSTNSSDAALREQTDKFEAFFLKQVLDIAMNSEDNSENSLFPKDAGDKIYKSMYNDTMSTALSGNLGLSEMLFNYLKEGR
ncbi:rod-binding protein [Sulfurospirillum oryzae]|uniref:rod-binding protein n=1 Tax=Sulfurospirillum oryzae TaxID=2976535 RepID=UPI0021E771AA|nr:rod-binding protein [Sulfurospirillum oryzae]